ncbi:hypothetical protein PVL29_022383 [Vitis rotundifolia]|uniref:Pentatricopeptide repeat-containing protein n=1 Tax=Vitis rotundifolia TaxID=103349 RepID=A0AA38YVG6_VITRO|nr:hypothetical protein PVL29_022383 [Vitis rotundifolia]
MERYLIDLLHCSLPLNQLKQIQALIIIKYLSLTPLFIRRLLNASFIQYARQVFDQIPQPDQGVYCSFISAYSRLSLNNEALRTFVSMHQNNVRIVCFTIPPIFKSCASLLAIDVGKQVHSLVIRYGFHSSVFGQNALINFYAKINDLGSAELIFDGILVKDTIAYNCLISAYSRSGEVLAARELFDKMRDRSIVSWNAMISCYAQNGDYHRGWIIFQRMQDEMCEPDEITLATMGMRIKKLIDNKNLGSNMIVSTAMLEMYVKCGAVDDGRLVFNHMARRDCCCMESNEALELFESMNSAQIKPNDVTLVSVLSACAQLGSVATGERIGSYVESRGLISNVYVASALLSMYSKCGNIMKAREIFDKLPQRDNVTWNSMIMGLAINGFAEDAIALYNRMKEIEVKPNNITFVGLLTACTHAGHVELGLEFFRSMRSDHNISPNIEHFACIVDLFCRSGRLIDAYEFICRMEVEPNVVIWGTLLSASRIHVNVELAELAGKKLLELEPDNSGNYVILSNIYASAGRWQEALKVRKLMKDKRVQKAAAYSWVEVEDRVHKFLVGDTSDPRSDEVYSTIDGLALLSTWVGHELDFEIEA